MNDLSRTAVSLSDGTALDVLTGGGGTAGPDLVYIHGLGGLDGDLAMLGHLQAELALHAPALTDFEAMRDVPLIQRICSEAIAALGLERPMLAGHGAGAAVAAELAAAPPDDFGHLFLIAPLGLDARQRPVSGEGMHHRLAHITARATLIRGKHDQQVTAAAILDLAQLLPNSALVTVAEAGHDAVASRPDAVARGFLHGLRVSAG